MNAELLSILCCPETRQGLRLAEASLLDQLNRQITSGSLKNRSGRPIVEKLTGGLVRSDGKFLYPVHTIPVLLVDEGIALVI